jgi:hypothetical protein
MFTTFLCREVAEIPAYWPVSSITSTQAWLWGGPNLPQTDKSFRSTCQLIVLLPIIQDFIMFLMSWLALLTLLCFGNFWTCLHNLQICPTQSSKLQPCFITLYHIHMCLYFGTCLWHFLVFTTSGKSNINMRGRKEHITQDNKPQSDKVIYLS